MKHTWKLLSFIAKYCQYGGSEIWWESRTGYRVRLIHWPHRYNTEIVRRIGTFAP